MGLFRKSPQHAEDDESTEPSELEVMQAQLAALQRRVENAEIDQTHLGAKVVALDDLTADLSAARLEVPPAPLVWQDPIVEARFADLNERLDQIAALGVQLDQLGRQITEIQLRADERHMVLHQEVEQLRGASAMEADPRVDALDERLTAADAIAAETSARLAALDDRLTNVSTELANQITELGSDVDAIADLPSTTTSSSSNGAGVGVEQLELLSHGQTRLAQEQARYEIAFRDDLAALAEQIRKSTNR